MTTKDKQNQKPAAKLEPKPRKPRRNLKAERVQKSLEWYSKNHK